jgi:hypothetical protein
VDHRANKADAAADEEAIVAITAAGTETTTASTVEIVKTTVTKERMAAEATGTNAVSFFPRGSRFFSSSQAQVIFQNHHISKMNSPVTIYAGRKDHESRIHHDIHQILQDVYSIGTGKKVSKAYFREPKTIDVNVFSECTLWSSFCGVLPSLKHFKSTSKVCNFICIRRPSSLTVRLDVSASEHST